MNMVGIKLSNRQIEAIIQRAGSGENLEKIAADYSVHSDTVRAWCNKAGLIPRRLREIRKERRNER